MAVTSGAMTVTEKPWFVFFVVLFLGTGFCAWNYYHRDPDDTQWNDSDIPPAQAPMVLQVPGSLSPETAPMETSGPMRHRKYATSLIEASASIIGTF
jgi:hypothetical protein